MDSLARVLKYKQKQKQKQQEKQKHQMARHLGVLYAQVGKRVLGFGPLAVSFKKQEMLYSASVVGLTYDDPLVSLEDVRMTFYLTLNTCKDIFDVMAHVTKNIDEGRTKMKAHCPIVADVGMKENALKILMVSDTVIFSVSLT
ncbi:hypothetical protein L2E82_43092 [Cichorium intybus]|uniref:Uncharacterized protein n=1 Tax=Cichorium intybus TaxID=13427 RepID=A0ACB8ZP11_CICIN|nr:hypothetical protein L2E82_43092 [Cichorium intybus]